MTQSVNQILFPLSCKVQWDSGMGIPRSSPRTAERPAAQHGAGGLAQGQGFVVGGGKCHPPRRQRCSGALHCPDPPPRSCPPVQNPCRGSEGGRPTSWAPGQPLLRLSHSHPHADALLGPISTSFLSGIIRHGRSKTRLCCCPKTWCQGAPCVKCVPGPDPLPRHEHLSSVHCRSLTWCVKPECSFRHGSFGKKTTGRPQCTLFLHALIPVGTWFFFPKVKTCQSIKKIQTSFRPCLCSHNPLSCGPAS